LSNVACVGASWVVTAAALAAKDWAAIEANARFAAGL
jgi:2-dehydro-3-deoxyphosphogluconate aldolase/(4S)-4-hydroxy-2-oxoglutarate aldolase